MEATTEPGVDLIPETALIEPRSGLKSLMAAWPDRGSQLLLRGALCDLTEARRSWDEWKSRNPLDDTTWEDQKLLAVVTARLAELDPECADARRLQGLAKALWTAAQVRQQASLRALDILIAAQFPVLLLKGPAFDLAAPRKNRRRLSGDLDIMVRRRDLPRALALLAAHEWRKPDCSLARQLRYLRLRPGINLAHGNGGDLDIHHQPIHSRWMSERALDRLWQRARPTSFGGRNILIPSDADLLCISASHGLRRRGEACQAAWAIDFHHVFSAPHARLQNLPEVAHELGVGVHVFSALHFLQHTLGKPIDPDLMAALEQRSYNVEARLRYYLGTPASRKNRRWLKALVDVRLALLSYCSSPLFSIRHLYGKAP